MGTEGEGVLFPPVTGIVPEAAAVDAVNAAAAVDADGDTGMSGDGEVRV